MTDPIPKAALITGCSTGIGRATAERLGARVRWTVYATARRPDTIADLEPKGCRILQLDVTDEDSMSAAVSAVESEHGAVGALVNNAGYAVERAVETVPMNEIRRQFETNFFGLVRMCQLVLPAMRKARYGRIVNVSSVGGKATFPGGGYYHATKYAVEAFSDALRYETAPFGIGVSIIQPGLIKTAFGDTATAGGAADDVYGSFNEGVARRVADAYEGVIFRLTGSGPEPVAAAIENAISSRRPRTRYRVTPSARIALMSRKLMPDRAWDAFMRTQYPRPKPSSD
jgi:NAD(P)-dependent dehydrogenase (short-subunit alcohol dehydrogenase family)